MNESRQKGEISLVAAALRLRESYHTTRTRMLRGEILGRQIANGRWYVLEKDIARIEHERESDAANSPSA